MPVFTTFYSFFLYELKEIFERSRLLKKISVICRRRINQFAVTYRECFAHNIFLFSHFAQSVFFIIHLINIKLGSFSFMFLFNICIMLYSSVNVLMTQNIRHHVNIAAFVV